MVRGIAAGVLLIGWFFVAWQNRFHFSAPLVVIELAYTAVIAIIYNMYRTGASVVAANEEDDGEASWGLPMGARHELEREKKALLKSIKEAEFDQMMGKLSVQDADQMTKALRARAIEVIKEIDRLDGVGDGTIRDQIEREVKARLEIETVIEKKAAKVEAKVAAAEGKKKARGKRNKADAKVEETAALVDDDDKPDDKIDDKPDDKPDDKIDDKPDKMIDEARDADEAVVQRESSTEAVTKEVRS